MLLKRRKSPRGFLYIFYCPACKEPHTFDVREGEWSFDGDYDKPSFSPSLIWPNKDHPKCHIILKEGIIHYLDDCKHHMKGKNVPMVEHPE